MAANQRLAGLYTSDNYATEGLGLPTLAGNINIFAYWPTSVLSNFEGKQLTAVRIAFSCPTELSTIDIYGETSHGLTPIASQTLTNFTAQTGWDTIQLTTPWTISTSDHNSILIGFTYKQVSTKQNNQYTTECFPLSYVEEGDAQETYIYGDYGQGTGFYSVGTSGYGNLSIQAIVEGDFPANDISLKVLEPDENFYQQGADDSYYGLIVNNFGSVKANYQVNVSLDGAQIATLTHANAIYTGRPATDRLGVQESDTILSQFTVPADAAIGTHNLTAKVATINGQVPTDNTSDDELSATFKVYKETVARQKNLVEHHTSSTCTYCYLGEQLLSGVNESVDNMVWVSIHGNQSAVDPANTAQCDTLINLQKLQGWPSAAFNRTQLDEGTYLLTIGYRQQYIQQLIPPFVEILDATAEANPSFVSLSIDQNVDANRKATIKVNGTGTEGVSNLLANNRLYVYLAEDSIKFDQYSDGKWVANDNHNHVFRVALGTVLGNQISWNGNNLESTLTYDIPTTWNIEHLKSVAFVAPALDNGDPANSGVNQAEEAYWSTTLGINGVKSEAGNSHSGIHARYNIAGQRISQQQSGLNIVRMADGRVVKYIAK